MTGADRSRTGLVALLAAETVSTAGTRMSAIALPWLVLRSTGDPARTGLVVLVEFLPMVVLQVLGAPLIDRFGAKRVSVVGNVGAGLALGCVPLLALADDLALVPLLCCVFVAGLLRGPADSASQILVPAVAGNARMPLDRVTALVDGAQRAAGLLGAPVGAVLIAVVGASSVVALDAVSFLVAAVLVAAAVPRAAGVTREPATAGGGPAAGGHAAGGQVAGGQVAEGGYVAQLRVGLVHLGRDRLLRSIAGMVLFTNLVDAACSGLLLIVWARDRFDSATPVGLVGGALGGGALLGALAVSAVGPRLPRRWTFAVAFLVAGAPRLVVLALGVPLWTVVLVWAVAGVAAGAINPLLAAAEYERVPRELQARVLGALGGVAWAGIPFGALLAGLLVQATDLRTALVVGAVLYGLTTLDPFVRPAWALMDRRPVGPLPLPPVPGARPGRLVDEPDTFVHE